MRVGLYDAKNRFSELVAAAERGEEVVITKRGAATVKLTRQTDTGPQQEDMEAALARAAAIRSAIAARGAAVTADDIRSAREDGRR